MEQRPRLLSLGTGDLARSAMLAAILEALGGASGRALDVRRAGTHARAGEPAAPARDALGAIDELVVTPRVGASHQLELADLEWADVVLATAAEQVRFVREAFPAFSLSCCTLGQFVREAPLDAPWSTQVALVAASDPEPAYDLAEPTGTDQAAYDALAGQLFELVQVFLTVLGD